MHDPPVRIVSLLPAATEIVAALGLAERLVGRSHECDEPPHVARLPALTAPRIDPAASSREIHEQVGRAVGATDVAQPPAAGTASLFTLDVEQLAALAPDLILTQATCAVCAVATADVEAAVARAADLQMAELQAAGRQPSSLPRVLPLSPTTLEGVFTDILTVGAATGTLAKAREVIARLQARCDSIACRTRQLQRRIADDAAAGGLAASTSGGPRVALVEWLDPPMAAGNWVPQLVALAGGTDVLGHRGSHSHWISWDDLAAADPDVVVLIPCGFPLERVVVESASPAVQPHLAGLRAARTGRLWAVDGHHLFNRPGPRLVDSLEVLAEILHPGSFAFSATRRFARRIAA
jgi:iron complex transport system substrate-binding protein